MSQACALYVALHNKEHFFEFDIGEETFRFTRIEICIFDVPLPRGKINQILIFPEGVGVAPSKYSLGHILGSDIPALFKDGQLMAYDLAAKHFQPGDEVVICNAPVLTKELLQEMADLAE